MNLFSLEGRNAWVTGASGGIGFAIAEALGHAGARIIFNCRSEDHAQKAIADNYNLKVPHCVQEAINRYKADNDWMTHFLDECCEVGDGLEEKFGELYSSYRAFCARSGEFCRSTTEFYGTLNQRGFARHKRKKGIFVLGLQLAEAEADF